jgi:hypothetical protein
MGSELRDIGELLLFTLPLQGRVKESASPQPVAAGDRPIPHRLALFVQRQKRRVAHARPQCCAVRGQRVDAVAACDREASLAQMRAAISGVYLPSRISLGSCGLLAAFTGEIFAETAMSGLFRYLKATKIFSGSEG